MPEHNAKWPEKSAFCNMGWATFLASGHTHNKEAKTGFKL
jgi:hypothetical protein